MKAFMQALEGLGKGPLEIGKLPPTPGLVDQFFNDSTGEGQNGAVDVSTEWAKKNGFELVEKPAFEPEKMEVDGPRKEANRAARR
jgi:Mn-containing catalase